LTRLQKCCIMLVDKEVKMIVLLSILLAVVAVMPMVLVLWSTTSERLQSRS